MHGRKKRILYMLTVTCSNSTEQEQQQLSSLHAANESSSSTHHQQQQQRQQQQQKKQRHPSLSIKFRGRCFVLCFAWHCLEIHMSFAQTAAVGVQWCSERWNRKKLCRNFGATLQKLWSNFTATFRNFTHTKYMKNVQKRGLGEGVGGYP